MEGWIKLHRCIEEWKWVNDLPTLRLWVYILAHARHEDGNWNGVPLKAGQMVIGRKSFFRETGITEQTFRTSIRRLKDDGTITTKSTNKCTIVTIANWGFYQKGEEKPTSESTSKSTSNQPATNQQLTTNKNEKNERMKEPPPPTPSRGEKPKNPPLFPESEKSNRNGGGGSGFDDILLTEGNRQELSDFLSSGLTMEIVQHAVDEAAANGQKKWAYVRGILNRYKREGIKTVDQARASDGKSTFGLSSEELQRKRREEARTLALLRGELPADKPKTRKEKYICVLNGEEIEYEREVIR